MPGEQLSPGGALMLEVGLGQAEDVCALLRGAGYASVQCRQDLTGIERVVIGTGWQKK